MIWRRIKMLYLANLMLKMPILDMWSEKQTPPRKSKATALLKLHYRDIQPLTSKSTHPPPIKPPPTSYIRKNGIYYPFKSEH